ncbi:MAG TPA: hypothetical protein VFM64_00670 [Candidatus Nitrosotenuis sp.]|nr:hypothetical protein [Candidatus Nitrosotenuis sp.]
MHQASGHALLNSAEETIGHIRVQIATNPEIPEVGQKVKVLLRVTDEDKNLEEVPSFTMGIRIFYHDKQIDGIPPQTINSGHWQFDYAFKNPGNHVFRVDLYDEEGRTLNYTFNMSTQSPFGWIFIYVIASGGIGLGVLAGYIFIPRKLKKMKARL